MILLDTCTLLWLAADQSKLSDLAKETIQKQASSLCISSISAFEIAIKSRQKKLILPQKVDKWFQQVLDFHGIKEIPVTSEIAIESVTLPALHNDPCDRFIIATAKSYKMDILTCDKLIAQYKGLNIIW